MSELKLLVQASVIASSIVEEYQKSRNEGLFFDSDELQIFLRMRVNVFNPIKEQLLNIEDRSERYKLLEAYKILSQISFDMLSKEVMGDN